MFLSDLVTYCQTQSGLDTYFQADSPTSGNCLIIKIEGEEQDELEMKEDYIITLIYVKSDIFLTYYSAMKSFFLGISQLNGYTMGTTRVSASDISPIETAEQDGRWVGFQTFRFIVSLSNS